MEVGILWVAEGDDRRPIAIPADLAQGVRHPRIDGLKGRELAADPEAGLREDPGILERCWGRSLWGRVGCGSAGGAGR